jgi:thioredoxin-dependent peroxiredoxin
MWRACYLLATGAWIGGPIVCGGSIGYQVLKCTFALRGGASTLGKEAPAAPSWSDGLDSGRAVGCDGEVIRPGELAPDFTLESTVGGAVTLSTLRGSPVVLAFYPGDDTTVCTLQLRSYNEDLSAFEARGAQLLALSPQGLASHEAFAVKHHLRFPLLVDRDKAVGEIYGVLGPLGFYRRSIVVIDPQGVVRWAHRALTGATYRHTDELAEVLDAL